MWKKSWIYTQTLTAPRWSPMLLSQTVLFAGSHTSCAVGSSCWYQRSCLLLPLCCVLNTCKNWRVSVTEQDERDLRRSRVALSSIRCNWNHHTRLLSSTGCNSFWLTLSLMRLMCWHHRGRSHVYFGPFDVDALPCDGSINIYILQVIYSKNEWKQQWSSMYVKPGDFCVILLTDEQTFHPWQWVNQQKHLTEDGAVCWGGTMVNNFLSVHDWSRTSIHTRMLFTCVVNKFPPKGSRSLDSEGESGCFFEEVIGVVFMVVFTQLDTVLVSWRLKTQVPMQQGKYLPSASPVIWRFAGWTLPDSWCLIFLYSVPSCPDCLFSVSPSVSPSKLSACCHNDQCGSSTPGRWHQALVCTVV